MELKKIGNKFGAVYKDKPIKDKTYFEEDGVYNLSFIINEKEELRKRNPMLSREELDIDFFRKDLNLESPKDTYYQKLEQIHAGILTLSKEHRKIFNDISAVRNEVVSSREVVLSFIKVHPIEVIKIISFLISFFSLSSLAIGKILNRLIIAPDIGLLLFIVSTTFFFTSFIRLNKLNNYKKNKRS